MRTTPLLLCSLAALAAGLALPACGSSSKGGNATPQSDAGDGGHVTTEAGPETGSPEASGDDDSGGAEAGYPGYPAFPPATGVAHSYQGPVLAAPHIVTISWARDTNTSFYQAFDDAIGASNFWKELQQYGVGPATSAASDHVVIQSDLSSWDARQIETWAQGMIEGAPGNGWPAPDSNIVYLVYTPPDTTVTQNGSNACSTEGGYHTQINPSNGGANGVPYAISIGSCFQGTIYSVTDNATITASHELAEASTDPFLSHPAYFGYEDNSLAWSIWGDWELLGIPPEVGDMCELMPLDQSSVKGDSTLPYAISTIWSNSAGAAGSNPCAPEAVGAAPFHSVTPLGLESITVNAIDFTNSISQATTMGWHIPPGTTANVSVGFYSEAPTGAWNVQAYEGDCCQDVTNYLTVTPPSFTGNNGTQQQLSITVNKAPTSGNAILLTFWSAEGKYNHVMPVVIGAY